MANPKRSLIWRLVASGSALVALGWAIWFGHHFLAFGTTPVRAPIPVSELQSAKGSAWTWRIPDNLRLSRWRRAPARVWEEGKPLPLRAEEPTVVTEHGQGRFCLDKDLLWLSTTDNTNPTGNGRRYELEVHRPLYRSAIWAAIFLASGFILGLLALPQRIWSGLYANLARPGEGLAHLQRRLGIVLAFLAAFFLVQILPRAEIAVRVKLPPAALIHESGNDFFWHLPRWMRHYDRAECAVLFEDQRALKRVSSWTRDSRGTSGSYHCSSGRVGFRASDASNPALNGRAYALRVLVFPPQEALRLAVFLGIVTFVLFAYATETPTVGFRWQPLRKASWWLAMLALG